MTEKKTVTVAGVPVTAEAADSILTVTIGRFDPAAADGPLSLDPGSGTAVVGVYIAAGETGDPARLPVSAVSGSSTCTPARPARRRPSCCATAATRAAPACSPNARTAARTTLTTPACACATAPMSASGAASPTVSAKSCVPASSTRSQRWVKRTRTCGGCTSPTARKARSHRPRRPGTTGTATRRPLPGPRPAAEERGGA